MPPKPLSKGGKKSKAEEALAFLEDLDNLDVNDSTETPAAPSSTSAPVPAVAAAAATSSAEPRASTDSKRSLKANTAAESTGAAPGASSSPAPGGTSQEDEEAAKALAFLEEQINTKRAPLSVPGPASLRSSSPLSSSTNKPKTPEPNIPTSTQNTSTGQDGDAGGGGWGSWWSTATSAVQVAQKLADESYKKVDEGYKKVRAEGVQGLEGVKVGGVDLGSLRKGAEERLKGIQGLDLDKLRQDLLNNTQSALTTIINTVAPPISAHETLELWLSHPMIGYSGVEGVVYRAWTRILEQTESGELVVVWSPPASAEGLEERGMYPVDEWQAGWDLAVKEVEAMKGREDKEPVGRGKENPNVPVTTVPIFLHLQPVLAPLSIPEPPLLLTSTKSDSSVKPPNHLYFILTLQDPQHSIRFTSISQPSPGDWLEVEYERSDWVEERLVDVLRTAVEVIAQDYVATRMGLKPNNGFSSILTESHAAGTTETSATSDQIKEEKKD